MRKTDYHLADVILCLVSIENISLHNTISHDCITTITHMQNIPDDDNFLMTVSGSSSATTCIDTFTI